MGNLCARAGASCSPLEDPSAIGRRLRHLTAHPIVAQQDNNGRWSVGPGRTLPPRFATGRSWSSLLAERFGGRNLAIVVHVGQDGTDGQDDGGGVGEDPDDAFAASDHPGSRGLLDDTTSAWHQGVAHPSGSHLTIDAVAGNAAIMGR